MFFFSIVYILQVCYETWLKLIVSSKQYNFSCSNAFSKKFICIFICSLSICLFTFFSKMQFLQEQCLSKRVCSFAETKCLCPFYWVSDALPLASNVGQNCEKMRGFLYQLEIQIWTNDPTVCSFLWQHRTIEEVVFYKSLWF